MDDFIKNLNEKVSKARHSEVLYEYCIDKVWYPVNEGCPYRLLECLSTSLDDSLILDIGTCLGTSAICLSKNKSNRVISYDIHDCVSQHGGKNLTHLPNIEYRIGNCLDDPDIFKEAGLISLDIGHDGLEEQKIYDKIKEVGFKGWLVLDDIYLNPEMVSFWNNIDLPKRDITNIGHSTGTGLVFFNG